MRIIFTNNSRTKKTEKHLKIIDFCFFIRYHNIDMFFQLNCIHILIFNSLKSNVFI